MLGPKPPLPARAHPGRGDAGLAAIPRAGAATPPNERPVTSTGDELRGARGGSASRTSRSPPSSCGVGRSSRLRRGFDATTIAHGAQEERCPPAWDGRRIPEGPGPAGSLEGTFGRDSDAGLGHDQPLDPSRRIRLRRARAAGHVDVNVAVLSPGMLCPHARRSRPLVTYLAHGQAARAAARNARNGVDPRPIDPHLVDAARRARAADLERRGSVRRSDRLPGEARPAAAVWQLIDAEGLGDGVVGALL